MCGNHCLYGDRSDSNSREGFLAQEQKAGPFVVSYKTGQECQTSGRADRESSDLNYAGKSRKKQGVELSNEKEKEEKAALASVLFQDLLSP